MRGGQVAAAALLLLLCLLESGRSGGAAAEPQPRCPEDSVLSDDGECKCVSPCLEQVCQAGQQPVRVREAIPERPGSCCPLYECRNQVTLSYVAQEETGGPPCLDSSGRPRELSERWQDADDPCVNCTCEASGVSCQTAMCRSCARPMPRAPGECCPKCPPRPSGPTCPPPERSCDLDCDLEADESGCQRCSCRQRVNSTPQAEEKPEEEEEEEEEVVVAGVDCPRLECLLSCEFGLILDGRNCSVCACRPRAGCPVDSACERKCPQGYRTNELGCPSCRCRGSCVDERNVTRPEGATWSDEPCRSCLCDLHGQITCNETVCEVACAEPEPPAPGQCCPRCPTAAADDSRGWGTIQVVLMAVLGLLCVLLMVHLVRGRFRARLAPSEADFAGFPPQYYKCVPVYETQVPVLRHAEKMAPL